MAINISGSGITLVALNSIGTTKTTKVVANGLETTGQPGTTNVLIIMDMLNMETQRQINTGSMTPKIGIGNTHISSMDKICQLLMPMVTSLPLILKPMNKMNMLKDSGNHGNPYLILEMKPGFITLNITMKSMDYTSSLDSNQITLVLPQIPKLLITGSL